MTGPEFQQRLSERAAAAGLSITPALTKRLDQYYRLLATWNRRINLTALNLDALPPDAIDRLFIEPIRAARYVPPNRRVLDVGSGGGSPAIPFTLAADAATLTMVESRARKSVFLREAARAVGLNAEVVTARFEELKPAEPFDVVTIRAVRMEAADWGTLCAFIEADASILLFHQAGARPDVAVDFTSSETHPLTSTAELTIVRRNR